MALPQTKTMDIGKDSPLDTCGSHQNFRRHLATDVFTLPYIFSRRADDQQPRVQAPAAAGRDGNKTIKMPLPGGRQNRC